jgi:nucleoid-associated protein YgaU
MTENDYVELLSRVATRATGIFDEELRGCLDKRRQEFTRAHAALHVLRGNGAVQAPDYVIRKLALTAVQRDLVYEEDRGLASARLGLNTTDIRNEVARYIARVASHGEEKDIKASYNDVWLAAPSLGVRVTDLKEVGGKLYVTATAQYAYDKDRLWEAIKKHADWEKNLVADITVANTDVFGYHVVKSGDTLRKIAQLAYGDAHAVKRIVEANRNILKDPKHIKPGQRLKIPR